MQRGLLSKVFISYVSENFVSVQKLSEGLKNYNIEVWLDREQIEPGSRWKNAIRRAIKNGSYFIACFSDEYYQRYKTYMNEELLLAIEQLRQFPITKSWFIPVRLSNCELPDISIGIGQSLKDIQWVDLFRDWDEGLRKIKSVIKPINPNVKMYLLALEQSSDLTFCKRAIDALVEINATIAENNLIEIATGGHEQLRGKAIEALCILGGKPSASALANIAKNDDKYAESSILALKKLGDLGLPHLIEIVINGPEKFRGKAIDAISNLGGKQPACVLTDIAKNDDKYAAYSTLALKKFGEFGLPYLNDIALHGTSDARCEALKIISQSNSKVDLSKTESLLRIALKEKDKRVSETAAWILLWKGNINKQIADHIHLSCHDVRMNSPGSIPSDFKLFRHIESLGKKAIPALAYLWEKSEGVEKYANGMLLRSLLRSSTGSKAHKELWEKVKQYPEIDYNDYSIP